MTHIAFLQDWIIRVLVLNMCILKNIERAEYVTCNDNAALDAFFKLSRLEGIIPALESCHAVSYAMKLAKKMRTDQNIIVTLSGRGDKDIDQVIKFRKKYIGGSK
jgi:Tryptophan synthase beta chain